MRLTGWKMGCAMVVFCSATAMLSVAQDTFTTLVTFDGGNGLAPYMVLAQGADGNFYGTTYEGGTGYNLCREGCGTVFQMTPAGTLTTLHTFCSQGNCTDGASPRGALVQAADGNFYGTTAAGGNPGCSYNEGCGTVFKITPTGTLTTLYSFCALPNCADGAYPGGLVQGRNGNFYGAAGGGGNTTCSPGCGTVFEITPTGKLTTLYNFCSLPNCADGYYPNGPLLQTEDGSFYGEAGGSPGLTYGTIYKLTPGGKLTTLANFDGHNGKYPAGGLIQATDGNFYGIAQEGGGGGGPCFSYGCGTVFKITREGQLTTLHHFTTGKGAFPNGPLVQGTDGNLYGTTGGNYEDEAGTIFEITSAGSFTTLYSICSQDNCDGIIPAAGLLQATNGTFYGTTSQDGDGDPGGTVFSFDTGLGPFVKTQPTFANEGVTIGIFGQGFTSSSMVQFGGVQATSVKLYDADLLEAKVPAGALTGSVTVTTNGTTLTSNQQFSVTPQLLSFSPPSGSVGTQVTITGVAFTQATGVGFGDTMPAQFTVNSDTQITATVPSGAKSGPVGVVTKGGTAISTGTFTVN